MLAELDSLGLLATPAKPVPRPIEYADLANLTYTYNAIKVQPPSSSQSAERQPLVIIRRSSQLYRVFTPSGSFFYGTGAMTLTNQV